jgi:4-amino-4-deoxy-L-arabinose transferase-like glycosyltransferase
MGMQWRSLSVKLKSGFDKWRLFFLVFLVVYALFLVLNLGSMTIQWDEANHLNGGLLLLSGRTQQYMDSAMFYPPLNDLVTTGYFSIGGVSVFSARLVAVTFAVLSVWVIFEFTKGMYGRRTALISSIFLGTMPGVIWLARVALLETMLMFFFSLSMYLFFKWLRSPKIWLLVLIGIGLGLGFLTKYQIIIAVIAMVVSVIVLCGGYLKSRLSRLSIVILIAAAIVLPWIIVSYQVYSSGMLDQWLYAMTVGNPDKLAYSTRFPMPIFYLLEMVWPYGVVHPISIFIYILGLVGLGFLLLRRKPEDKFLLIWFGVVYIFFTLIGNKQWRYVVPLFPVLAVSAASLIVSAYGKIEINWKNNRAVLKSRLDKVGAGLLIGIVFFSVAYSCENAYAWVTKDEAYNLPVEVATNYTVSKLNGNESLLILCSLNVFCPDIVGFYVDSYGVGKHEVEQYPDYPVDTFTPNFNVTELIDKCVQSNVKYLLLFEYGETYPYLNSTLTMQQVYGMVMESERFTYQTSYGEYPCRIFILSFA